jgi:hypothetical protein
MSPDQLRPLGFGEILDGAFTLYRRHFATFVLTALLPQTPVIAIYLMQAMLARPGAEGLALRAILSLLVLPFIAVGYALARAALVHEAASAFLGRPVSRSDSFGVARKRFWAVLGTGILSSLAVWVGLLFFIVPGILIAIMFFAGSQVAVLEDSAGPDALGRSKDLANGAWGRVAGIWCVLYIAIYMPVLALGVGGGIFLPRIVTSITPQQMQSGIYFVQVGAAILGAVVQPIIVLGMTLLYYDRRVRTEALDLQQPAAPAYA